MSGFPPAQRHAFLAISLLVKTGALGGRHTARRLLRPLPSLEELMNQGRKGQISSETAGLDAAQTDNAPAVRRRPVCDSRIHAGHWAMLGLTCR